jgi:hypothetical protein
MIGDGLGYLGSLVLLDCDVRQESPKYGRRQDAKPPEEAVVRDGFFRAHVEPSTESGLRSNGRMNVQHTSTFNGESSAISTLGPLCLFTCP